MAKKATVEGVWKDVLAGTPGSVDVPFRSMSNIQKAILEFRDMFRVNPPVKRGVAKPTGACGVEYNYFLTEDLMDYVNEFLGERKMFLDTETYITNTGGTAIRFTIHDYERTEGDTFKYSDISIGNPASIAELGARITYAQKYLLSVMFGVSIATDTDAFSNGVIKQENGNNKPDTILDVPPSPSPTTDVLSNESTGDIGTGVNNIITDSGAVPILNATDTVATSPVEHTKSYPLAKEFIVKSLSNEMLDSAVTKVTNSMSMREDEKVELLALITTRRSEVTS